MSWLDEPYVARTVSEDPFTRYALDLSRLLYILHLRESGRGTRLLPNEIEMPGVLEVAFAVSEADAENERPLAYIMRSEVQLSRRARRIIANWLERDDKRIIPSHELSPADHKLSEMERRRAEKLGLLGPLSHADRQSAERTILHELCKAEGVRPSTFTNWKTGRRGSTRKHDQRL